MIVFYGLQLPLLQTLLNIWKYAYEPPHNVWFKKSVTIHRTVTLAVDCHRFFELDVNILQQQFLMKSQYYQAASIKVFCIYYPRIELNSSLFFQRQWYPNYVYQLPKLGNEILSALVCWLQLVEIISEGAFLSNEE